MKFISDRICFVRCQIITFFISAACELSGNSWKLPKRLLAFVIDPLCSPEAPYPSNFKKRTKSPYANCLERLYRNAFGARELLTFPRFYYLSIKVNTRCRNRWKAVRGSIISFGTAQISFCRRRRVLRRVQGNFEKLCGRNSNEVCESTCGRRGFEELFYCRYNKGIALGPAFNSVESGKLPLTLYGREQLELTSSIRSTLHVVSLPSYDLRDEMFSFLVKLQEILIV